MAGMKGKFIGAMGFQFFLGVVEMELHEHDASLL